MTGGRDGSEWGDPGCLLRHALLAATLAQTRGYGEVWGGRVRKCCGGPLADLRAAKAVGCSREDLE